MKVGCFVLVYFSVQNLGPGTFPAAFLFVFSGVHSDRLYRDVTQLTLLGHITDSSCGFLLLVLALVFPGGWHWRGQIFSWEGLMALGIGGGKSFHGKASWPLALEVVSLSIGRLFNIKS